MTFKRVLRDAGLNKSELAALYGVSRQTIHTWAKGGEQVPGSLNARMSASITAALCAALDKRMLPFPAMDRDRRVARVESMARTLQNLKPSPA